MSALMCVTWRVWPWQFGGSFTVPTPSGVTIFVKHPVMISGAGFEHLRVHERVHAQQCFRLGAWRYWLRVMLWARISQRSLLAKNDKYEREAYSEQSFFMSGRWSSYDDKRTPFKEYIA